MHRVSRPVSAILAAALIAIVVSMAACTSSESPTDGEPPRVLVLGIDGGTWDVMDPMIKAGKLPNIAKLTANAVHGVLESRPPALSPVVWTTIFTGQPHAVHGIVDWKHSQSSFRKVRAVWDIASSFDKETFVFNVPGSWPPEEVSGVMYAGFPLSGSNLGGNTGHVLSYNELVLGAGTFVNRDNSPRIVAEADKLEVGEWSDWFPAKVLNREGVTGVMRLKRLGEDKYFIAPFYRSDPGMKIVWPEGERQRYEESIGHAYIPEGPGWSLWDKEDTPAYLYDHCKQVFDIQTAAALSYIDQPWDLFLYVMTLTDRISHPYWAYANPESFPEIDREKAALYATAVADSYIETDKALGELGAKATKADGTQPYVVLASDHGFQANRDKSKPVGTHHFDGIYLVAGPGIKGNTRGDRTFIEDIAPTVLHLLGLPIGADMEGKVIPGVLAELGDNVRTVPSYEGLGGRHLTGKEGAVDASTWEQLCGLGYVDCEGGDDEAESDGAQ
jgi:hypothetical protein